MSGFLLNPYAYGGGSITLQSGNILSPGTETTISYTGTLGYFDVLGEVTVDITAYGGAGGRGAWAGTNEPGGPGGIAKGRYILGTGRYYYFVGNGNISISGKGGPGGGSTDVRTVYSNGTSFSLDSFMQSASLNSRIIVAGGGGGAHGGGYGAWGTSNSPGAGGPTKTDTNSRGTNDNGFLDTGADSTQAGLDGGSSVHASYTKSGVYGAGGIVTSQYNVYTSSSSFTGMGWPNGGSGTTYANGGGGGGWYGGASNWPNGGGGSNYLQSYGSATLVSQILNTSNGSAGDGSLIIQRVS